MSRPFVCLGILGGAIVFGEADDSREGDTMNKTTQAIVFTEPYQVDLITVSLPDPGPTDVVVRTVASGISVGTERWALIGRYNRWGEDVPRNYPHAPGYQRAGIVEAVGSEVNGFAVGDRVVATTGARLEDEELRRKGWFGHIGTSVLPQDQVWGIGPMAQMDEASLFIMACVGAHGVRLIDVQKDNLVVVIGQGMIGQMSAQMARLRGATVITSDLIQKRVDMSALHSADLALNGQRDDLLETIQRFQPEGADVVIDTSGNASLFDFCRGLIRREGSICLQGYYPDLFRIEFHPTHLKRAKVAFPCGYEEPETVLPLLARRKVRINPLITHRFPVSRAREAYDLLLKQPDEVLGIVIDWE